LRETRRSSFLTVTLEMKKPLKVFLVVLGGILLFFAVSVKISEKIIINRISHLTRNIVSIGSISFSLPPCVKLERVAIANRFVPVFMKEVLIRPAFRFSTLAFAGPGGISISEEKRDVKVRGSVTGNFKEGELNIRPTSVSIDKLGSFEVKGLLEKWGREGVSLNINLNGTEIREINDFLGLKIPFSGKATGTALLDFVRNEPEKRTIRFDVVIKELSMDNESKFTAFVKGVYKMSGNRADISDGKLLNATGGKILFTGFVDKETFNMNFETEKMPLEDLLKFIPEETRRKYNISAAGGSASMKDFNIEKVKKKSC